MSSRDIYGRKPTSESRGKTQQRIMDLQHAPGQLPEMAELLQDLAAGSIGQAIDRFVREWVTEQAVTSRRSYERTMMLLVRDFQEPQSDREPELGLPAERLDLDRLVQHLRWRISKGLVDEAELRRATVHLARFSAWARDNVAPQVPAIDRESLRAQLDALLASRS